MADRTPIEWTDATWNSIRARRRDTGKIGWHCEHVSEGCRNCYAETINRDRLGTRLAYKPGHRGDVEIFVDEKVLLQPLHWRRPRMIFVGSMTDLFADFVTDSMLDQIFAVMALCRRHTFQVLTKRPARMRAYLSDPAGPGRIARVCVDMWLAGVVDPDEDWPVDSVGPVDLPDDLVMRFWPLPNAWLGTSCEDQATVDARIPELLATPAAVRFVSAEPLLGPIDFQHAAVKRDDGICAVDALTGSGLYVENADGDLGAVPCEYPALDWIIVGGESGRNARPMSIQWVREIRDQCIAAEVAFLFKQWGEWAPHRGFEHRSGDPGRFASGDYSHDRAHMVQVDHFPREFTRFGARSTMERVGKRRAGRLLDGAEHNDMPGRSPAPQPISTAPSKTTGALA